MRALVLGHALDPTANAVATALAARAGGGVVRRATLGALTGARWWHRLQPDGTVSTRLDFGDGDAGEFDVVFNRVEPMLALGFEGWSAADRDYGQTEWLALLLSWLESLGDRVINRPAFGTLNGPADRPWLWLARADTAGLLPHPGGATSSTRTFPPPIGHVERLELLPFHPGDMAGLDRAMGHAAPAATTADVLVIGDTVLGDADAAHPACCRLARLSGTDVLAIRLAQMADDPRWRFVAANPAPVVDGGPALAALVALMAARAP